MIPNECLPCDKVPAMSKRSVRNLRQNFMSAVEAFEGVVSAALVYSGLASIAFFPPSFLFFHHYYFSQSSGKSIRESKAERPADGVPFQPVVSQLGVAALWRGRNKKAQHACSAHVFVVKSCAMTTSCCADFLFFFKLYLFILIRV